MFGRIIPLSQANLIKKRTEQYTAPDSFTVPELFYLEVIDKQNLTSNPAFDIWSFGKMTQAASSFLFEYIGALFE